MSLSVAPNERLPWSRITDTTILKRGDLLRILGLSFEADVAVLDKHDPRGEARDHLQRVMPDLLEHADVLVGDRLPAHHHVLVQFKGDHEVLSTGMYVGHGEPDELFFDHVVLRRADDPEYLRRINMLNGVLHSGNLGLYFMSDQEGISRTAEGQAYLRNEGDLDR